MWSPNHQGIFAICFSYLYQGNHFLKLEVQFPPGVGEFQTGAKIKGLALII